MAENLILFGYSGFDVVQKEKMSLIAKGLPNCSIVLMQDAVIGTNSTGTQAYEQIIAEGTEVYCLNEDLQARGMEESKISSGLKVINYGQLIDLIEKATRLISWL